MVLVVINSLIFVLISIIHFYWLTGGTWAMDLAVPTSEDGTPLFKPSKFATFIVAIGLLFFGWINFGYIGWFTLDLPSTFFKYVMIFITAIFAIRSIGDFRYVGFSKRFKESNFAKLDSKFYSPLCFGLALSHALLLTADLFLTK